MELRDQGRVVRELVGVAPVVAVGAGGCDHFGGDDQVVEAVAAARAGPLPARLLRVEAVQLAEGVAEAVGLEAADQRGLGSVPAFAAVLAEAAGSLAGEGPHGAVG